MTGDNAAEDWGRMAEKGAAQRSVDPGTIFVFDRNLFEHFAPPAQELRFAPPTQESRQFAITHLQSDEGEGYREFSNRHFTTFESSMEGG